MSVSDVYLSGLFDGEGSVGITVRRGSKTRGGAARVRENHVLICALTMTHEAAVRLFYQRFGGQFRGPLYRPSRQPQYTWRVLGEHAVAALNALRPYLLVKAPQADLALEFMHTRVRMKPLSDAEVAKRENYRQQIIQLNGNKKLRRVAVAPQHPTLSARVAARQERYEQAQTLRASGLTYKEIAARLHSSPTVVSRWVRGLGSKAVT